MTVEVVVDQAFPYESTDPENPGMVHGAIVDGKLVCSQKAFDELKKLVVADDGLRDGGEFFALFRRLRGEP